MSATQAIVITDASTRAEVAEAIGHLNQTSKRQQRIVGTEDYPSKWDISHRRLDGPLDDWLAAS